MIFYSLAKTRRRKEIGYALGGFVPLREIIFFAELRSPSINLPSPKEQEGYRWIWSGQIVLRIA